VVVGPWFEDPEGSLDKTDGPTGAAAIEGEVLACQRRLATLGYYEGEIDGWFGPKQLESLKAFQEFSGLEVTGVLDMATKSALLRRRYDALKDDTLLEGDHATYPHGTTVTYSVGFTPGYLPRHKVLNEISRAFKTWGDAATLDFRRVSDKSPADVRVEWTDLSDSNELFFDGPGGKLAQADARSLILDSHERWLLIGQEPPEGKKLGFGIFAVVLHEIGHVLGLVHEKAMDSVMSPYYNRDKTSLSPRDKARVAELYAPAEAKAVAAAGTPPPMPVPVVDPDEEEVPAVPAAHSAELLYGAHSDISAYMLSLRRNVNSVRR